MKTFSIDFIIQSLKSQFYLLLIDSTLGYWSNHLLNHKQLLQVISDKFKIYNFIKCGFNTNANLFLLCQEMHRTI